MNEIITLVQQAFTTSAIGDTEAVENLRDVFAKVETIGLKRKMEALEAGLKLEYKFTLADELEYAGEQILIYNGTRYNIVGVYVTDTHKCELTTARF